MVYGQILLSLIIVFGPESVKVYRSLRKKYLVYKRAYNVEKKIVEIRNRPLPPGKYDDSTLVRFGNETLDLAKLAPPPPRIDKSVDKSANNSDWDIDYDITGNTQSVSGVRPVIPPYKRPVIVTPPKTKVE